MIRFPYRIGQRVLIDDDDSIRGVVTGLASFEAGAEIRVEWFHGGVREQQWFGASRLTLADGA